jgi:predicted DNA-binding transcriptional regulator AlpA
MSIVPHIAPRPAGAAYSVAEFKAHYRMGHTTFYRLVNDGKLKAVKIGRRTIVTAAEADRWFASLSELNPSAPPPGLRAGRAA